ncbi:XRE family transcriptional regulator [Paenibacillus sp. WLX2291]|uniref:XRE family transcriptional regulator n=1 Tax=Paenibacillus sp. WLX2291 TaxID=3296934 RepID=UPI0039841C2B
MTDFFSHQQHIAQNLTAFIRLKGYSKLSFSKLTGISRPTVDQILKSESPNPTLYNQQIAKITQTFQLPDDYLLRNQPELLPTSHSPYAFSDHAKGSERTPEAKELLEGLDHILDLYSMYIK